MISTTPSPRSFLRLAGGFLFIAASFFLSGSSAVARPTQMPGVPLEWKPSGDVKLNVPPATYLPSRIVVTSLRDARPKTELVGENHENEARVLTVTTTDSVPVWCKEHLNTLFAGETHGVGPEILLSGEVERFFVRETDDYAGETVLKLTARTRGGEVVWSGTLRGTVSHFGRTYKAYNYDEGLSDSLIAAAGQLTRDAAFIHGMKRVAR